MEESYESGLLSLVIIAILILLVIGVVVWMVMSRRTISGPVTPIPLAPLQPVTNTSNVPTLPANVQVVDVTPWKCKKNREDSCGDDDSCSEASREHSSASSSGHSSVSSQEDHSDRIENSACHIEVYDHALKRKNTIPAPSEATISLAHCSGQLYAATGSSIHMLRQENWELVGQLEEEETISSIYEERGKLRVRTDRGQYTLTVSRSSTKMSPYETRSNLTFLGETVHLSEDGTLHVGRTDKQNVESFCLNDGALVYVQSNKLHMLRDNGMTSSKLSVDVRASCMSDKHIYLLAHI